MPVYKVGEDIYNIPEDKVQEFLSAYPNAVLDQEEGKTQPQVTGAPAGKTAAPDMESKSESTSSVLPIKKYKVGDDTYEIPENLTDKFLAQFPNAEEKKDNFFQQMATAWSGGQIQADLDDYLSKAVFSDKYAENISDEDAEKLLNLWQKQDASGLTEGEEEWEKDFDAISASNVGIVPDWFAGAVGATIRNPQAALLYGARSFAMMFSKENIGLGAAGAAAAAGAGAALGSVAPGVGTAIGGVGGAVKGAMAGLGASVELFAAFGETIRESLPENYTVEDIQEAFKDEELLTRARNRAATRAGTIAAFDLVAAGAGGKAAGTISKKALAKGVSKKAGAVAAGTTEGLITTTGEFTGELAAQKAAGDELDFKEAVLEVFGVSPTAIGGQAQTARNLTKSPKYKIDGKEMSRAEVNKFIDDNNGMDLSKVNITVENDQLLQEKMLDKQGIARFKTLVDKNITDDAARTRIAELELERAKLASNKTLSAQERKAEVEEEIKTIQAENKPGKGRPTKIVQEQRKEIEEKAEQLKVILKQRRVADTVAFAKRASEQTKGMVEVQDFDSTEAIRKQLFKDFMGDKEALQDLETNILKRKIKVGDKEVNALDYIGGVAYGGKIYINKQVAARTGQINVGAHEVLHGIINTKISQDKLGGIIGDFRKKLSKDDLNTLDNELRRRGYKPEAINDETLTVFSDLVAKNQIKFNEGLFNKVGDFIVTKILRPLGFKQVGFENGKQVYQFMKEYQKSVSKGELNQATLDAISRAADVRASKPKIQLSKVDVNSFVTTNSLEEWKAGGADEVIANLYFEDYFDKIAEVQMAKPFDKSKTTMLRDLPGFLPEDFKSEFMNKMIQHIRNFDPSKNDSLEGWINAQISNKVKQVLKEGKVTEETFTSQVDEGKVTEEIDDYDQYDEIGFEFDMVTNDGVLINPLDFIGDKVKVEEFRNKIKDAVNGIDKIDNVTFKTLEDLVPEITESVTGIPVKKLANPKANITTGEIKFMQKFIYDNADKLIKLLPEGAVLEAASEKLIGTGTGVPRKLLQYFYNKNPRITKGAGLSPFEKMPDINKKEFLSVFGINEDGSTLNFGGQDQRAQTIFALGRLVGKLMTNTAVRQELEVQQINRNVIVDVGAGRSEFQLSQMPESITTYKDAHNEVINKHAEVLKKDFGLTDQQINELLNSGIGIWEKRNKKEAIWNRQGLIDHYNFVGNFMAFLPPSFIKNRKTFIVAALGYHARENGYGVDWKKTPAYKVLEGDRELSIGEILNDRIITIGGKQYDVFSREGRDGLLKINNGTYSQETIEALDALEKLESKAKGGLFAKRHTSAVKIEYSNFGLEETRDAAQALFDKDQATLAALQNKAFNLLMQDFIASQDNKFNALLQAKKIYSTSASVANGLKSAVTIGGVIFDPKGNYHFEHAYSALEMNRDIFENLILNKKVFKKPEAWFIPVDMKNELDATEFKTANRNDFVKEMLRKAEKDHVITPDNSNFNLSIAPTLETMTNNSLNEMVSDKLNINEKSEISEFQAKRLGKNRGKFKFFIPYSADDFMGLMYYMVRKGKQGDADLAFINDNLIKPFAKGQAAYEEYKQGTLNAFKKFKKSLRKTPADLKKEAINGLTNEQAIRVYIWNNLGYEIPGLSKSEINQAVKYVKDNDGLLEFSKQIQNMLIADFPMPQENWTAGSLTIDVLEHINETARKEFFKDFIAIAEETFGKTNNRGEITGPLANKLRAAFGDNYIEALSDALYRMKNGRAREFGRNRLVAQLENYINGSIGTIMFFNTRSALLQQLSLVNFINFSDNNPLAAAAAFADQKQFWKDYAELFNSDFLKQRRSGLKIDVNADDIARAAESSTNKAAAALSALLKAGYLPTQMADSHAISFGGATFYRNRINSLMKDGMSEQEAKDQAFMEFKEIAEENQQSSRPDKISAQQASTLGRLFLAFGNTPMQYARLTKKAALDLINNRGDWKTNTSKLLYYGIVQNIVFTTMQQGLFALAFDPEEDEEKEESRIVYAANSAIDGFVRGFGYGGAIAVTIKNMIAETMKQYSEGGRKDYQKVLLESATISPAISSKLSKLEQGFRTFTWKQELEKVRTEGISLDNPAFEATGKFVSATTNIPLDRVIRKADNVTYSMRHNIETWQTIALMLGYGKWEIGLQEKTKQAKNKKPKVGYKKKKSTKKKI